MSETVTQTETDQRPATARSLGAEEKEAKSDEQFQQERTIKGFRWFIVIISILSSVTLYSLDNTIVADIQPQIINTFDELDKLPWLSVAFLVACVATNSIWYESSSPIHVPDPELVILINSTTGARYTVSSTRNGSIFFVSSCSRSAQLCAVQRRPSTP